MKNIIVVIIYLSFHLIAKAQQAPELIINDIGANNDVVIEMETNDDQASDFRNVILGVNQSSQAWFRTLSNGSNQLNNNLSFWTNAIRRLSIIGSDVGINTTNPLEKLHLRSGNALINLSRINQNLYKSEVNFYDFNTLRSGISYHARLNTSVRSSLDISLVGNGVLDLSTSVDALRIFPDGTVLLPQLSGIGDRNLVANQSKALATEAPSQVAVLNLTPSHFRRDNTFSFQSSQQGVILPEYVEGRIGQVRMAAPIDLPQGSRIVQIEIHFIDYDPLRDVEVRLIRSGNDLAVAADSSLEFTSAGMQTTTTTPVLTQQVNFVSWTIGDPRDFASFVQIDMGSSGVTNTGISSIELTYELP